MAVTGALPDQSVGETARWAFTASSQRVWARPAHTAHDLVAEAAYGDDLRCQPAALAELDAQTTDVHVDRATGARVGITPDQLGQGITRHNLIGPRREDPQQTIF